jgi:competence protein ComEC
MPYLLFFSVAAFSTAYLPQLPSLLLCIIMVAVGLLFIFYRYYLLACCMAGLLSGCLNGYYLLSQQLPEVLEGRALKIEGRIKSLPKTGARKQRFLFEIERVIDDEDGISAKLLGKTVQLSWYLNQPHRLSTQNNITLMPGQLWMFTVKLRRPRGLVNPSGFDYQAYLLRHRIYASGYILGKAPFGLLKNHCWSAWIECMRWHIGKKISALSSASPALAPILALAIGDTQALTHGQWQLLKNTGTIHLLAISGLHVGLAATIGFLLGLVPMKIAAVLSPYSYGWRLLPAVLSVSMATFYSLLAGMSLPTQRALVMVLLFHAAGLLNRRIRPSLLLSGALLMVSLTDPLAVYSQGFWLSFLAVALLMYGFWGRNTVIHNTPLAYGYSVLKAQWVLAVGLLLPNLLWLQGMSISAPLANSVAVSWVSLLVVPILFLLMGVLLTPLNSLAQWIYGVLDSSVMWLLAVLEWFNQSLSGFWQMSFSKPSGVVWVICGVMVVVCLMPRGVWARWLGVLGLLPLFFPWPIVTPFQITFLDAGQGTAIVVTTSRHSLVYDTGRAFSDRFNVGEHIIAPYLRDKGISRVDRLIISHNDGDHAGGLDGLIGNIGVEHLLSGQVLPDVATAGAVMRETCQKGQKWKWDGVIFSVLWPDRNIYPVDMGGANNNHSCVLLIQYQGRRILLAGDIEAEVEAELLHEPLLSNGVDMLLVPHHGSKSSSSPRFLALLQPEWAIVTAGYKNQYGHPHPEVQKRYNDMGSQLLNTANYGALQWTMDGQWVIKRWRVDSPRYWYSESIFRGER